MLMHKNELSIALPAENNLENKVVTSDDVSLLKHRLLVLCGDLQLNMATGDSVHKESHIHDYYKRDDKNDFIEKHFISENSGKFY